MFRVLFILFTVAVSTLRAEEQHSVMTAVQSTTLSGYVNTSVFAVGHPEFRPDSGNIYHPYISEFVGSKMVYVGSGQAAGKTKIVQAVALERVDGISTVKVTENETGKPLVTNWYAQDVFGNIWGVRSIDGGLRQEDYLKWAGKLEVGAFYATQFGKSVEWVAARQTADTVSGTFTNCLLYAVKEEFPGLRRVEYLWLVPGVGIVKVREEVNSQTESLWDLDLATSVLIRPVEVATEGRGTVSIRNGQHLQVGKTYTAKAIPAAGFRFGGWSSPTESDSAELSFTMQNGLKLTANFLDSARPAITVTYPKNGARVLTSEILLRGTAKDNVGAAAVWLNINQGGWMQAQGIGSWSNLVSLRPGANQIQLFAEDTAGNRSPTNTLKVTYVKTHPVYVSITGRGSVSPNLNGKSLEVGKTYTVTAVPAPGFRFGFWQGIFSGTEPKQTFTMGDWDGASLGPNFVDVTPPSVAITSPKANARVTTNVVRFSGTAKDNVDVSSVWWRFDGVGWTQAEGRETWGGQETIGLGSHTLEVYSMDLAGNYSKTNRVTFRVPDYRGIYFGNYSEPQGRGLVGMLVTADQKLVVITGDTTSDFDSATKIDYMEIGVDGKFDQTIEGERTFGTFTDTGFSGKFITTDNATGTFSGAKKPATGVQADHAGYYVGTYQMPGETGEVRGILAADGKILVTVLSQELPGENGERAGGAGMGTVSATGAMTATVGGAPVQGTLQGDVISGTFRAQAGDGTFQMTQVATPWQTGNMTVGINGTHMGGYEEWRAQVPPITQPEVPAEPAVQPPTATQQYLGAASSTAELPPNIELQFAPAAPVLEVVTIDDGFGFVFSTEVGHKYRVEGSYDFVNWSVLLPAFTATAEEYQFVDPELGDAQRFYRVVAE